MLQLRTSILALLLASGLLAACSPAVAPMDARGLLVAMHDRYNGVRPATMTFVQTTILHRPGAEADTSTWYEAAVPGRLRIDFAPVSEGNSAVYDGGMLFVRRAGQLVGSRAEVNPLLLLLMDVYQKDPAEIAVTLDSLGVDLSIIREAEWEGRPVWVVGAAEGDETSMQFWVEKERLVTLRVIQPVGGGASIFDARVVAHREMSGYPQEVALLMYLDGALYQEEYYDSIRAGVKIDPALFDTSTAFITTPYWR